MNDNTGSPCGGISTGLNLSFIKGKLPKQRGLELKEKQTAVCKIPLETSMTDSQTAVYLFIHDFHAFISENNSPSSYIG